VLAFASEGYVETFFTTDSSLAGGWGRFLAIASDRPTVKGHDQS
jgi:hypothetical protein